MDPAGSISPLYLTAQTTNYSKIWILVGLYVLCLILSAYFAASETAFTAVSRVRLRTLADKGNKKAKKALWISDRFDKTLTTILIGNNVFHSAGASLTTLFLLEMWNQEKANALALPATFVTALVVYLFAEMIPKSISKVHNEKFALFFAGSMRFLVRILTPISAVFTAISNLIAKLFSSEKQNTVTEEEIISIIETIEDEGVLEPEKQALVNSAMEFRQKLAQDIMVPMDQVVSVSSTTPKKELVEILKTSPYSRIPVYEESLDKIIGIVYIKDLIGYIGSSVPKQESLRKIMREPYFVPESMKCGMLFQELTARRVQMAVVVDEYGGTAGIVTLEDVLESIVGNIQDEYDDEEEEIKQINETTFTIDGTTDLDEVNELVGVELPEGDYDTLGGFVISLLGYLPEKITDEPIVAEYENLKFTVLSIDERRMDEIKVEILPKPETDGEEDDE